MKTHQVTSEVWHFQTTETVGKMSVGSGREWILKSKTTQWSHILSDFQRCACLSFGETNQTNVVWLQKNGVSSSCRVMCLRTSAGVAPGEPGMCFFCCRCTLNDRGQLLTRDASQTGSNEGLALAPPLIFEIKPTRSKHVAL